MPDPANLIPATRAPVNLAARLALFDERIETEHGDVAPGPGEPCAVPRGVRRRPVTGVRAHVMPVEIAGMPNTDDPASAATMVEN